MRHRPDPTVPLELESASLLVATALDAGAPLTAATDAAAVALGDSSVGRAFAAISVALGEQVHPWKAFTTHATLLGLSVVEPLMGLGGTPAAFRDAARVARAVADLRRSRCAVAAGSQDSAPDDEALEVGLMLAHALESGMPLGSALRAAGARIGGARCDWAITAGDNCFAHGEVELAFEDGVPGWFCEVVVHNVGTGALVDELRRVVAERTRPLR